MKKTIWLDMDDTLNKFYDVPGWLQDLQEENVRPYVVAEPKYDMEYLANLLEELKTYGYMVAVTTWLAKNSKKAYDDKVRQAKKEWLEKYNFPYDKLSMVKYGTTKANSTRKLGGFQILFDDNEQVRKGWTLGTTINAKENIIPYLENILLQEKVAF